MRQTRQMRLILDYIDNSYAHPTAQEVYEQCRQKMPHISLGTVYRNLNKLSDLGLIKRIKMPDNIDRFDHVQDNHPHFICERCGVIIDLDKRIDISRMAPKDVKITTYEINFKGICEKCQRKGE